MKAVIMAGGEGTRLRPLTCGLPKPLTKLCNRPVVEYILDLLDSQGCEEAIFTLRYRGNMLEKHFETHKYKNIKLYFVHEEEPLGTAGCVKNAVKEIYGENAALGDFLVISGDALCDFDLSQAMKFQKQKNADATIVTKQVNDPREYGLVLENGGRITGFSEKPSFLNCVTDCANTGIYIINSKVTQLIPDGKMWDFAKDVFPQMIKQGMSLYNYAAQGYWCDIGDLFTYRKSQIDMLSGEVKLQLKGEKFANGFFSQTPESEITNTVSENVKVIPPCYIGKNVKIGDGSVIENTVLCDNVTIGKNVKIFGGVVLDGAYLGGNVIAENSIVCSNAKVCSGAVLGENSVVGENTVIGDGAELKPGVKIWQNKRISPFSVVFRDMNTEKDSVQKASDNNKLEFGEKGISGSVNVDIDMETAVRIGGAVSRLSEKGVLLSCAVGGATGAQNALKNAIASGLSACGVTVIDCATLSLPALVYLSGVLVCDIIVNISVKSPDSTTIEKNKPGVGGLSVNDDTLITILNRSGLNLTRAQERLLEGGLNRREYKTAAQNAFGLRKRFYNGDELYAYSLSGMSFRKSNYNIELSYKNNERFNTYFEQISNKHGEKLTVNISDDGTTAAFQFGNLTIGHEKLVLIAALAKFDRGVDVALPADFPVVAEVMARKHGRRIHRFFLCSNDDSDKRARELVAAQPFLNDGVYLSLFVLNFMAEKKLTPAMAAQAVPEFSVNKRMVKISCPPQRILREFCKEAAAVGEGLMLNRGKDKVLLRSNKTGDSLYLFAESASAETACALCDEVEKKIKNYLLDKHK
ncbi:MAG: sugar phosphate nucleotidyltransferase [Oscillospiraceae bacterium]|nr:sugar phosphate nucleotidyltransferase [Oscillospiraceae bacterium]